MRKLGKKVTLDTLKNISNELLAKRELKNC